MLDAGDVEYIVVGGYSVGLLGAKMNIDGNRLARGGLELEFCIRLSQEKCMEDIVIATTLCSTLWSGLLHCVCT